MVSLEAEFVIPISRLCQMKSDFCDSCQSRGWIYHTNFQITSAVVRFLWQLCLWSVITLNLSCQLPGFVGCRQIFVTVVFVVSLKTEFIVPVARLSCICGHWINHSCLKAEFVVPVARLHQMESDFCGCWINPGCVGLRSDTEETSLTNLSRQHDSDEENFR